MNLMVKKQPLPQTVLVTGGLGYIGSHTCVALMEAGHEVVIVDSLCNSEPEVLGRIAILTGRCPAFYQGDVRDGDLLDRVMRRHDIAAVVHFAGLKAVGDSTRVPLEYYAVNVCGSVCLLEAMKRAGVRRFVFSSSATVYGEPERVPIVESHPVRPFNPYGRTKLAVEEILGDLHESDPRWAIAALRYFNPAGAHESGLLGESPSGVPNNLMPYVSQVVAGQRESLHVFGNDYPTPDGTGVRDYVHVVDLAEAHVRAVNLVIRTPGLETINLGTGTGYSVLEVVEAYEAACGREIPHDFAPRRPGDVPSYYADPSYARKRLGWRARRGLDDMCTDAHRFQMRCAARDGSDVEAQDERAVAQALSAANAGQRVVVAQVQAQQRPS